MSLNLEQANNLSMALTSGAFAIATATTAYQNTAAITYAIDGVFRTAKAATNNTPFSAGHAAVPPASQCAFGIFLDAAGNFTSVQGPIVDAALGNAPLPPHQSGRVMVGLVKVVTNAATTFTPGTTALNAAGTTVTYVNVMGYPGSPV